MPAYVELSTLRVMTRWHSRVLIVGGLIMAMGCGDDMWPDGGGSDRGAGGTAGMPGTGGAGATQGAQCAGAGPETTPLDEEEQRFLELLNEHRAANGRSPLSACTSLNRAAQGHSEDMRDQSYFDHTGLDGSSPSDRACDACYLSCRSTGWGENIAAGNSDAEGTFDQWVNSPGHNANMLGSNFVVVGIGRATGGGRYGAYWTTVFGGAADGSCQ